mgnify:CR=1 FL=1
MNQQAKLKDKAFSWFELMKPFMECFYQPIYDTESRTIMGAEALLRVKTNEGKYLNTEEVVEEAENADWVDFLDQWMFREVCDKIPELRQYGVKRVNVNLSPVTCHDETLGQRILEYLNSRKIGKSEVCLEITERCKSQEEGKFTALMNEMTSHGIRIALDDFGKGESNLLRMIEIPFSTIKLDKQLVWGMADKRFATSFVDTFITFANEHKIQVTAEGVETMWQAKRLTEMGCHYLQGSLISKPLSYQEFCEFMREFDGERFYQEFMKETAETRQNETDRGKK